MGNCIVPGGACGIISRKGEAYEQKGFNVFAVVCCVLFLAFRGSHKVWNVTRAAAAVPAGDGLTVSVARVEGNDVADALGMHIWKGTITLDPSVTGVRAIVETSERGKPPFDTTRTEQSRRDRTVVPILIAVHEAYVGEHEKTFVIVKIGGSSTTTSVPGSEDWGITSYDGTPPMGDPSHRFLIVRGIKRHAVVGKPKDEPAVFLRLVPVRASAK